MPSDAVLRSLRRWLQVVAFLLGLCLVALADLGDAVTGYTDGLLFGVVGVAGGAVALLAGLAVIRDLAPDPPADLDREP
ncbi:MAG: hypothetical protein ABEJ23_08155 [Haloarculaceae archaeon]